MSRPYHQRSGWRWLPGMRWTVARAAPLEDITGRVRDSDTTLYVGWTPYPDAIPDLDDPATQGAALAVLREVTGDPYGSARYVWHSRHGGVDCWEAAFTTYDPAVNATWTQHHQGPTLAEALATALDRLIPE